MKLDLAKLCGGPGIIKIGDAAIFTRDGINLNPNLSTFNVTADGYEKIDERVSDTPIELTFTPAGVWGALSKLYPYFDWPLGSYITPLIRFKSTAIDTTTDAITLTNKFLYGLVTGEKVWFGTHGTLPSGIDADTVYYAHVSGSTVTLHASLTDATAGTNKVNFTTQGTKTHALVIERSIVLHTFEGKRITFYNAPITKPGDIVCAAEKTLFDQFTARAFQRNRTERTDAASRFLVEEVPFTDTLDADSILTQAYQVKWGEAAPFSLMETQEGVKFSFPHTMNDVKFDGKGVVSMRLTEIEGQASFKPTGIDDEEIFDQLGIQGAGATIGRSLQSGSNPLDVSGTGVFIRLYGAALKQAPIVYNSKDERAGELQFVGTRTLVGGVMNPVAFVGSAAPA